jgi:hypothetical protein
VWNGLSGGSLGGKLPDDSLANKNSPEALTPLGFLLFLYGLSFLPFPRAQMKNSNSLEALILLDF